jgi:hypothetical protein
MGKKVSKQARTTAAAKKSSKKSRKTKKVRRASVKRAKRTETRRSKPRAKAGSPFQLMIETINETERLRAKNERRDVTDETG